MLVLFFVCFYSVNFFCQSAATVDLLEDGVEGMPARWRLAFNVRSEDVELDLARNDNILDSLETILSNSSRESTWRSDNNQDYAAYIDINHRASILIVREKTNAQTTNTYSGNFQLNHEIYSLEPVTSGERADGDIVDIEGRDHVIRRELITDSTAYDQVLDSDIRQPVPVFGYRTGFKTGRLGGTYTVEMLIVVDYTIYHKYYTSSHHHTEEGKKEQALKRIKFFFAHVVNGIDMRYQSINDPELTIRVRFAGLYIAVTAADSPWTEGAEVKITHENKVYVNIYKAMARLGDWISTSNTNRPTLPVFDHASLYSGSRLFDGKFDAKGKPNTLAGLSAVGGICEDKRRVSVNRELGLYASIQTGAHELAHNMGAPHDGQTNECSSSHQFVMAVAPGALNDQTFNNPFQFSPCSMKALKKFLTSVVHKQNCLFTESPNPPLKPDVPQLPGQIVTVDEQCQAIHGLKSYYCSGSSYDKVICSAMYCMIPEKNNSCSITAEQRAYSGTTCGDKKWCFKGKCIHDNNAPQVNEACMFGDYKGLLDVEHTKANCSHIGAKLAFRCYDKNIADKCCKTCKDVANKDKPGCEYGDHSLTYCKAVQPFECYDDKIGKGTCCETCSKSRLKLVGCEYGDRAPWCKGVIDQPGGTVSCYGNEGNMCCESCSKHKTGITGCEYGDRAPWCATAVTSSGDCNRPDIKQSCCGTCFAKFNVKPQKSAECLNKDLKLCNRLSLSACYNASIGKDVCCAKCNRWKENLSGCEYGDRERWCNKAISAPGGAASCYGSNAVTCCFSCNYRKTGPTGCEYGDRVLACDKSIKTEANCSDAIMKIQCCGTCFVNFNIRPVLPKSSCKSESSDAQDKAELQDKTEPQDKTELQDKTEPLEKSDILENTILKTTPPPAACRDLNAAWCEIIVRDHHQWCRLAKYNKICCSSCQSTHTN